MSETRTQLVAALRKNLSKAARFHSQARDSLDKAADLALSDGAAVGSPDEPEQPALDASPADEWVRLAQLSGLTLPTLQRRLASPSEAKLVVSREAPAVYQGQSIFCGEFPQLTQDWPFDMNALKAQISTNYGGQVWRFSIQDLNGRPIRDITFRLAIPPKNPTLEELEPEEDPPEAFAPPDITSPPDELGSEMDGMVQFERKRAQLAAVRKSRLDMERESQTGPVEGKLDQLLAAMQQRPQGNGNELAVLLQAMQAQSSQQSESLRLVVDSIGQKLSSAQDSQVKMFEFMAKMMDSRANAQSEITKVQMESKKSEMDLIMRVVGERRDEHEMKMDKVIELIQLGMQFKQGAAPAAAAEEGEGKGDWVASLINAISSMAMGQVKIPADAQPPALPAPAPQPAPEPVDTEAQRQAIERMAANAARKIAMRVRVRNEALRRRAQAAAGMGVPAPQAAPVSAAMPQGGVASPQAQAQALVAEILTVTLAELETCPQRSQAVMTCLTKAPREWREVIALNDDARVLGQYFKPYADPVLLGKVQEALMVNPARQNWLMSQAGILRSAIVRERAARAAAAAVPPAAPPPAAPPPARAPEIEVPEAAANEGGPANA